MAETPEGKVKRWLYGTAAKPGVLFNYFPGAYVYKPQGGMFGNTGAPDCYMCWRGIFIGIEIKAEGGKLTTLQINHLNRIIAAGGIGAVLIGRDEIRLEGIKQAALNRIKNPCP